MSRDNRHVWRRASPAMLPAMSPTSRIPKPLDNPVIAARRAEWANLVSEAASRPVLSTLVGLICLGSIALSMAVVHGLLARHAATLMGWMAQRPAGIWAAILVLCLVTLVPPARRDAVEAESGWLAGLPQMPRAMHRWSRWRSLALACCQAMVLLAAVVAVHRLAPGEADLAASDWLPALIVPMLAWLVVPALARPPVPTSAARRSRAHVQDKGAGRQPRSVLGHWQWRHYKSRRWTASSRWSLGILVLIVPAGATFMQVGVTILVGVVLLQWLQLWSSSLRVVVQASALTAGLPQRPWPFVIALSGLPLLVAFSLPLCAFGVLAVLGLPVPAALVFAIAICGALMLHAAAVLAWRHRPRLLGLRSAGVLLAWVTLSQAAPFAAPLIWLALLALLLRLAGREAP